MTTFMEPPFWARRAPSFGLRHVGLSLKTPPTSEPIGLTEVKLHCRIDPEYCDEDVLLHGAIQAARMDVEAYTDRALITQTLQLTSPRFPDHRQPIVLPKAPLQSSPAPIITYRDAAGAMQTLDAATYTVIAPSGPYAEPGRILLNFDTLYWPWPPLVPVVDGLQIEYVAGYGAAAAVPWPLKQAMLLLVGIWYANREAGQIVRGSSDVLPFGVTSLLDKFALAEVA